MRGKPSIWDEPGRIRPRNAPIRWGPVVAICLLLCFWLSSCGRLETETTPTAPLPTSVQPFSTMTRLAAGALPTLYPTITPLPTVTPSPTLTAAATQPPPTDVPLDTPVLTLRYAIPALGLARELAGTVGNQITISDLQTGHQVTRTNQAAVLLEIQSALLNRQLTELPDECDRCVQFSYELPLVPQQGTGWLTDPVLLASVENFMAVNLGPHFPPGTALGVRRRASAYNVAQTLALMADGTLWRWLATSATVEMPVGADAEWGNWLAEWRQLDLADSYGSRCLDYPDDTLFIAEAVGSHLVTIQCPDLALPATLLPLYEQLEPLLAAAAGDTSLAAPPLPLPQPAILFYQRADGSSVTLFSTGRLEIGGILAENVVQTVEAETMLTVTATISAARLLSVDNVPVVPAKKRVPGDPFEFATLHVVALRTDRGVSAWGWNEAPPELLVPLLRQLDAWLDAAALSPEPNQAATPSS